MMLKMVLALETTELYTLVTVTLHTLKGTGCIEAGKFWHVGK